jgi:hypothetical protein
VDLALGATIRLVSLAAVGGLVVVKPRWPSVAIGVGLGLLVVLAGLAFGFAGGQRSARETPATTSRTERRTPSPANPQGRPPTPAEAAVLPLRAASVQEDEAQVTLRPAALAWDDAELENPQRGAYRWYGDAPEPDGWPALDSYQRFTWRQLEPTRGNYNWQLIDSELEAAANRGGRFGLRVMSANSWDGGSAVPDYLMQRMPNGFWFTYPDNRKSMYAPDWNDSDYLDRAEALIRALAQRYANDDRFGWIEIGPYGDFGEWHVWRWPYPRTPTGASDMTVANRQRLIDLHDELFPPQKLVQMIDSATGSDATMGYALSKSPLIGVRADCFGADQFDTRMREVAAVAPDRWKTAPIIVEYCGAESGSGRIAQGKSQVSAHHVSLVEGNHDEYESFKRGEQRDFDETRRRAGYRYRLDSLTLPDAVDTGSSLTITSRWANDGVAPTYADWDVLFQLRDPATGAVAWQGRSSLLLRTLLPTDASALPSVAESFSLGGDVAPGTYHLAVKVQDPNGHYQPLALALRDRADDGSYRLGSITAR